MTVRDIYQAQAEIAAKRAFHSLAEQIWRDYLRRLEEIKRRVRA